MAGAIRGIHPIHADRITGGAGLAAGAGVMKLPHPLIGCADR